MKDVQFKDSQEINNTMAKDLEKFSKDIKTSLSEAKDYVENLFKEADDGYYSDYEQRYEQTPADGPNGHWDGMRGESKYIPSNDTEKGQKGMAKLAEYGMDGISYKNCEPDYSRCNEGTVQIEDMTSIRPYNFKQADINLAKQWNSEQRDGRTDWTYKDVKAFRKGNEFSWHECGDCKTMHLVSRDIHGGDTSVFSHAGGVFECKIRDGVGGEFDE